MVQHGAAPLIEHGQGRSAYISARTSTLKAPAIPESVQMSRNNPIDAIRNSAFQMTIDPPDDASDIKGMYVINGSMHIIKGRGIYRVQLADEIDPKRTNATIPNTQQRVLPYGADCELVRQTLMTAKRLFDSKLLGQSFNEVRAIELAFDALKDIILMHTMRLDIDATLQKITVTLDAMALKNRSLSVPSVGEAKGMAETFIQKADHAMTDLYEIAKLFYGDALGKRWFESLLSLVKEKHGDDIVFAKFLEDVLPFLRLTRNARNCIEHPKPDQRVAVTDIVLLPTGQLQPPGIEIIHPDTPQPPIALTNFMAQMIEQLAEIFELMMVFLCGLNVQPFAGFPVQVVLYPPELQKAYGVRYGYGTYNGDRVVPFG